MMIDYRKIKCVGKMGAYTHYRVSDLVNRLAFEGGEAFIKENSSAYPLPLTVTEFTRVEGIVPHDFCDVMLPCKTIAIPSVVYCGLDMRKWEEIKEGSTRELLALSLFSRWRGHTEITVSRFNRETVAYACDRTINEIAEVRKASLEDGWSKVSERMKRVDSRLIGQRCTVQGLRGRVAEQLNRVSATVELNDGQHILADLNSIKLFYL